MPTFPKYPGWLWGCGNNEDGDDTIGQHKFTHTVILHCLKPMIQFWVKVTADSLLHKNLRLAGENYLFA